MKRRVFFTVGVIVVVCAVSCLVISAHFLYRARTAKAIRKVLEADKALHRQVFAEAQHGTAGAETVSAYTQGLRQLDMADCPTDFRLAYLDHIHAWESLARSRSHVITDVIRSLLMGTIPSISDEQPIREEIARTWDEVERIALSYGVEFGL